MACISPHKSNFLVKLIFLLSFALAISCQSEKSTPAPANPTSTTGDVTFWNDQAAVPNISVSLTGRGTGTITTTLQTAPACGTSGTATFSALPNGNYSYSASATGYVNATGTVDVSSGKCRTELIHLTPVASPATGSATFWFDWGTAPGAASSNAVMTVTMAGVSRISSAIFTAQPPCGTTGAANFTNLSPGSYTYTASGAGNNWNGTVVIAAGQCKTVGLIVAVASVPTSVMFWTDVNLGGTVTVNMNGTSSTITRYHTSLPACGATGTANISCTVPNNASGGVAISYTASGAGKSWSGLALVGPYQCATVRLQ